MEKGEPSCTTGGHVSWCSHYGKQYGGSQEWDCVVMAIVNSAAMNIGVHVSLSVLVSSVCMPSSGIAGPLWQFYFQFFKESPHCSP